MAKLETLLSLYADLEAPVEVGATPGGARRIFGVTGGRFEGPRLAGRVLPGGGDWLLVGADGLGRLDVRLALETGDRARIYMQYRGVIELNETMQRALAEGRETQFGDAYFMTQPHFETGDARYAWLNAVVAVGEGRALPGGVAYRVYHVVNG